MQVGIIVSNYNGWSDTLECLDSLYRQTVQDFRIYLIDDASTDDSVARLRSALRPGDVFLPQSGNLGFAAANNLGIRRALADGASQILLLNNDTICAPDLLEQLLTHAPQGAVCSPKMLFQNPPDRIWFAGGSLDRRTGRVVHEGGNQKDGPGFSQPKRVSFLTFCCVLIPAEVIRRAGYLDEDLFMYCEDVDYCIRLADLGVELWYLPQAKLWHKAGGTAGGMLSVYYITRNTLALRCRGCSGAVRAVRAAWAVAKGGVCCLVAAALGHRHGRSYGQWRGAVDFARGRVGRMPPLRQKKGD